ncbi:MAG: NAD(P)/FAD-dependent oxidoreductase [Oscillospiraceae bacterium]|jgi:protoporphyrinogen oxidase|nr:NAD(P)/FAD-dependent oxidoreductase [Oscillospiraceae bacterium]
MKKKTIIIGGGLTGLLTGYELLKQGYSVSIYESGARAGGLLAHLTVGKEQVEYIYHHIFTSDRYAIDLIEELGLLEDLKWYKPKNGLYINKKLYPFTSPVDLALFRAIPFFERIRTGLSVLKAKKITDYLPLESMTAKDWLIQNSGKRAYEALWKPLLKSKFDNDADDVSAVWIWNKFKLRGNSRENVASESLGYLGGSFGRIIDVLEEKIKALGGGIFLNHEATAIAQQGGRYQVTFANGAQAEGGLVVAAVAAPVYAALIEGMNAGEGYREQLGAIRYKANICMVLNMKQTLSKYYWTTVCEDLPFVLVIEQNNLMDDKHYGGKLVYLSRYLDRTDAMWGMSDDEIRETFFAGLKKMYPAFQPEDVFEAHVFRSAYSQPVVLRHYSENRPQIKTPFPNLYLAGMSQIYPEDRGLNYGVRLAHETKDIILNDDR